MAASRVLETHDLNERQPSYISIYVYRNFNSNWLFQIPKLAESRSHFVKYFYFNSFAMFLKYC